MDETANGNEIQTSSDFGAEITKRLEQIGVCVMIGTSGLKNELPSGGENIWFHPMNMRQL